MYNRELGLRESDIRSGFAKARPLQQYSRVILEGQHSVNEIAEGDTQYRGGADLGD